MQEQATVYFGDDAIQATFQRETIRGIIGDPDLASVKILGVDVNYTLLPKDLLRELEALSGYIHDDEWEEISW